ncbi:hypothetical protein [Leuconostoc citreum]|uniref:hypothetical protein n=1 Tax=Leuconostoc citreum TaxID=33964 RepID=UPI000BFF045C|nr:hypothetical protein [Leuconostoc citreum]
MTTVKQALNIMAQSLEGTEVIDERDKKFLELGITPGDRDTLNFSQVTNVGGLINILSKVDKNTPITYDWASMSLQLNEAQDGLYLYIAE